MAISKVILNSDVLMDVTDTTATPDMVNAGLYFYGADGQKKQGTGRANLWQNGDVSITASSGVSNQALVRYLPAGRYTIMVTNTTTWTGNTVYISFHSVTSGFGSGNRVGYATLSANTTSSKTFVIDAEAKGARIEAADSVANSEGHTASYTNIVLLKEPMIDLQAITNITPTESSQTVLPETGYAGMTSVQINAIPSNYVGSGITSRSSLDLSASGATVTAPAGYYASSASLAVSSGTAGTPTATKGTVSNHAVSVTPSVTNSAGYISGGTVNGTAVSVSASELVSGTYSVSASGTADVTNYASISVPAASVNCPTTITGSSSSVSASNGTLTLSKAISLTPEVKTAGYIASGTALSSNVSLSASVTTLGATTYHPSSSDQTIASSTYVTGTQTIKAVTNNLSAENIKSGVTVKIGDSTDDDCVASVTGTYSVKNVQAYMGYDSAASASYTATDVSLTVAKTGTYKVSWVGWRNTTGGTSGSKLYINGVGYGDAVTTFDAGSYNHVVTLTGVSLSKNDVVVPRAKARSASYTMSVGNFIIEEQ